MRAKKWLGKKISADRLLIIFSRHLNQPDASSRGKFSRCRSDLRENGICPMVSSCRSTAWNFQPGPRPDSRNQNTTFPVCFSDFKSGE
jgi:hypothetical protein